MFPFFRDYNIDPADSGAFFNSYDFEDCDMNTEGGISTPEPNPFPCFKYYCRVGGGYQAFRKKVNANRFLKQPD